MSHLVLHKDGKALLRYPLTKEKISIGRDPSCDIVLTDENISRLHCEILRSKGKWFVKDLSKNGTFINNQQIDLKEFGDGNNLRLGNWVIDLDKTDPLRTQTTVSADDEKTKIIGFDPVKKVLTAEAFELSIKDANGEKTAKKLKKAKISFGSAETNDVIIKDDYISKKHCKLAFENDTLFLIDLGSTNGTYFEGEKIDKIALSKKARFTIGKTEISVKRAEDKEKIGPSDEMSMGNMIGASGSMKEIFALIRRVAPTDATVCVTGESGTGKELIARSVHEESHRRQGPFVAINCAAIPPTIIESELFGHEKGAFTGAAQTHHGVFEQAHTGTLFLDEIGEMPHELQTRLLRVLETRTVRRVGGHRDIPVDVRIVAATNQDLKQCVIDKKFREDLFFRLFIIPIHIPPLRERKDDIGILAKYFAKIFSAADTEISISPKAVEKLSGHVWSGNVRELKNTIQRAIIMNKSGLVTPSEISLTEIRAENDPGSMPLTSQERDAIIEALRRCGGNQSKASHLLKIARTTLASKIRKYEIDLSLLGLNK